MDNDIVICWSYRLAGESMRLFTDISSCTGSVCLDVRRLTAAWCWDISNRKEVIDLTLGTDQVGDLVSIWHVSDEISLSDHRYIVFQVGDLEVTRLTYCSPKRTNWESYQKDLKANLGAITLGAGCRTSWHVATGHPLILSPKLSSQGGCLAKDGSLVEQRAELP
jgi:hypothetical protein